MSVLSQKNMSVYFIVENLLGKLRFLDDDNVPLKPDVNIDIELKSLEEILSSIRAVLLDAEKLQFQYNPVRGWLKELKDACYDAKNVLEELEIEALGRQAEVVQHKSITKKVCDFISLSKPPSLHSTKDNQQVKRMRERLEVIQFNMSIFNFKRDDNREVRRERKMIQSFVDASDVFQRDKIKEEIISKLLENHDVTPGIVSILGDSGTGKTTLAKLVYNDKRIDDHFEAKRWTNFSEKIVNKQIILDMFNSVPETIGSDILISQLQVILKNQKYLFVLDDVLVEDKIKWKKFTSLLPVGKKGSKIIVTTSSNKVISMVGPWKRFELDWLSYESGLNMFMRCAFEEGKVKNPDLKKIGELIVEKCSGRPLLLKIIARTLYFSTDEDDWKYVNRRFMSSNLMIQNDERATASVLKLGYDLLPPHLKRCFVYSSIFAKDHVFNNITLIQFWMAHGLLCSDDEEPESVGMRCINELRSRCFFQDFEQNFDFITFKMHDLVGELATDIANECLISAPFLMRGLLFLEMTKPSLSIVNRCIFKYPNLQALDLRNSVVEELPESIGNLKHLRYLNLTKCIKLKRLPSSIFMLRRLETLLLGGCTKLEELPEAVRQLINLRMLLLSSNQARLLRIECLTSLRCLGIGSCYRSEHLFENIDRLQALRTLIIVNCGMLFTLPAVVKNLSSLENLMISYPPDHRYYLSPSEWALESSVEELKSLKPHLRMLCIDGFGGFDELPPWLLQCSANTLRWLAIKNCPDFKRLPAQSLKIFVSLEVLEISSCWRFSALPEDMDSLTAMREIKVRDCPDFNKTITWEVRRMISHIPKVEINGKQMYGKGGLSSLAPQPEDLAMEVAGLEPQRRPTS